MAHMKNLTRSGRCENWETIGQDAAGAVRRHFPHEMLLAVAVGCGEQGRALAPTGVLKLWVMPVEMNKDGVTVALATTVDSFEHVTAGVTEPVCGVRAWNLVKVDRSVRSPFSRKK